MDPNETLRIIRLTTKQMRVDEHPDIRKQHADDLAEHVEALDEWLTKGGFLPSDWDPRVHAARLRMCLKVHGDWTGPHFRLDSCPPEED